MQSCKKRIDQISYYAEHGCIRFESDDKDHCIETFDDCPLPNKNNSSTTDDISRQKKTTQKPDQLNRKKIVESDSEKKDKNVNQKNNNSIHDTTLHQNWSLANILSTAIMISIFFILVLFLAVFILMLKLFLAKRNQKSKLTKSRIFIFFPWPAFARARVQKPPKDLRLPLTNLNDTNFKQKQEVL